MELDRSTILNALAKAVIEMDTDAARKLAGEAIRLGVDPYMAIMDGLAKGMDKVNELYEEEEYFVPELLVCADAMYAGIEVLRAHMPKEDPHTRKKIVIGVMKGDTHDIGKNLVKIMLDNAGFEMHDMGRDVSYAKFVDTAGEIKADVVCLSTLMTTTMDGMQVVIEDLKKAGINSKVLIGGGPISPSFAKNIGADGYAKNAAEAVKVVKGVLQGISLNSVLFKDKRELVSIERNIGGKR
ncbi:MAG: corrinoid protein [Deltaproteobacteria bacterium]|nr:corrinoid protein [Deltaproteobacteria bacterium]